MLVESLTDKIYKISIFGNKRIELSISRYVINAYISMEILLHKCIEN
jgi:hypothetical protein